MPRPVVDKDACTGCGTCVSVCPQSVLEIVNERAEVVNPDDCIGCRACESSCPSGSITVED